MSDPIFHLDDRVQKRSGYKFPGIIVSVFATLDGKLRYVVECTADGARGCLHIFSGKDLELRKEQPSE